MSEYQERVLTCVDCGGQFTLSPGEQAFHREKGFESPKRCKDCRAKKKERRERGGNR